MSDLISREALISEIKRVYCTGCNDYHGVRCRACGTGDALDMVEDAPAVDAEPVRHAKWVWDNDAIDWNLGAWVCSECRHRNENIHAGMPGINGGVWSNPYIWSGSNYCPNCGAKMKGDAK